MRRGIRVHLSYANVMATVAVAIALGGSAYAAVSLPANSVGPRQIRDGAVWTSKLANRAVTGAKLANHSITEANVAEGSLNGRAFRCAPGDVGLGNRDLCAFKLTSATPVNWFDAIQKCRARGNTPATLPTPAELMAFAPLGGSPFKGVAEFWTSDISSGMTDNRAWDIETDANGNIAVISSDALSHPITYTIGCVYHAADVF